MNWKPSATLQAWKDRQDLVQKIRSFFMSKSVLEVDVPTMSRAMGTDPHLDYFETRYNIDGAQNEHDKETHLANKQARRFLTTSPEFHLKRLLAAGFPDIYYLGHAFRNGEVGDRHNCEFTILEWYRLGMDWYKLMDEVASLCARLSEGLTSHGAQLARQPLQYLTWRDAYQKHVGFDPIHATLTDMQFAARQNEISLPQNLDRAEILDALMVLAIEPRLGKDGPEFLCAYPAEQAALAQVEIDNAGQQIARRFELYLDGVELCNGYQELSDANEQKQRFTRDLEIRAELKKAQPPIDQNFIAALQHGLPACSGVALGVDRLVMLLLGKKSLSNVLLFPDERA